MINYKVIVFSALASAAVFSSDLKAGSFTLGLYQTKCINVKDDEDGTSSIQEVKLEMNTVTQTTRLFGQFNCQGGVTFENTTSLSYATAKKAEVYEGTAIDLIMISHTLNPKTDLSRDKFNNISFCGVNDWNTNTPREVNGLDCAGSRSPAKSTVIPGIMATEKGNLRFESADTDVYPFERPQFFSPDGVILKKVIEKKVK